MQTFCLYVLVLFNDNNDIITVNIISEGCDVSHCTHPIGINQGRGLISTQTCPGSGWGGAVAGDKKERLLLSRKERKVSSPTTLLWGELWVRGGFSSAPHLSPHLGKSQFTSHAFWDAQGRDLVSLVSFCSKQQHREKCWRM